MTTVTNTIGQPQKRFTLAEMSAVMMDRRRVPYGFFVSTALWDNLSARMHQEVGVGLGVAPVALHGVQVAIDPALPATEFDVAFTEKAWSERLAALRAGSESDEQKM